MGIAFAYNLIAAAPCVCYNLKFVKVEIVSILLKI